MHESQWYNLSMSAVRLDMPRRHRFTVEDYHELVKTGMLRVDDRIELIDGEIIHISPIGIPHAGILKSLMAHFGELGKQVALSAQDPLLVDDHSEPQPDLVLLRPPAKQYRTRHPVPADAMLLIEVADSSWDHDRNVKRPLYAEQGIAELWVVDAIGLAIHVCRQPLGRIYLAETVLRGDDKIAPLAFPAHTATVRDLIEA